MTRTGAHGEAAIRSRAPTGLEVVHGLPQPLSTHPGAKAIRLIELPGVHIAEHAHDWPVLSIYVMGSCRRRFDQGLAVIRGLSAVLHPPGAFHSSDVGPLGFEQIDIEFDPTWLGARGRDLCQRMGYWHGGRLGDATRRLARLWTSNGATEAGLSSATRGFLELAMTSEPVREPSWLTAVLKRIDRDPPPSTLELAEVARLSPAWLTQAYRRATGEGLPQTLMRKRVERAALLLRGSGHVAAEVAIESGFCDQSHMIRSFRQLLGRTPSKVCAERAVR